MLADIGYHCGLIGKLHLSRAQDRIEKRPDDGFMEFHWSHHPFPDLGSKDAYIDWLKQTKKVDAGALYREISGPYGVGIPTEYHQSTWCGDKAVEFISRNRDKNWLLCVNPFDPHPPFNPPAEYLLRYNKDDMPYPAFQEQDIEHQERFSRIDQQSIYAVNPYKYDSERGYYGSKDIGNSETHNKPPCNYDARMVKACYYAQIELLDTQMGRIVQALKETAQLEKTIIIFMSDHGELLGDHGLIYKGCRFYEALVHVPLIFSWPSHFLSDVRSDALVELIDVAPTLLDTIGLEPPYFMQGKSLYELLRGRRDLRRHKPYVVSEIYDGLSFPGSRGSHGSMYFDGRYKICRYHDEATGELYDLLNDPFEHKDLWNDMKCVEVKVRLLEAHFDAMMGTISPGIVRTGDY